jgi:uracil phosphoribosyltransferase
MNSPIVIDHPLVAHHLTVLRDKSTSSSQFRNTVDRLGTLVAYEATRDLLLSDHPIETPIQKMIGKTLHNRIGMVPILRAGIGMVDAMMRMIPTAEVWHLGLYRDEKTSMPVRYYDKLPPGDPVEIAYVLDPMLATGGSAMAACETLKKWGVRKTKMLSIIAAPEGIKRLSGAFPDVTILTCSIDDCLNENNFIVPGLGDAGDRYFNTTG